MSNEQIYTAQPAPAPAASGEPPQIRADFEQRMIGVGASPTALTRTKSGGYLSPSIEAAWEAEKRKYATAQPAPVPAAPVSWDRLRALMDGIPTREEFIGGQRQLYVAKEAVMGWLYEAQLRAERESRAAPQPAPARVPLTEQQVWGNDAIMSRNAVGGLPMHDLMRLVRAIETAHGITAKEAP